MCMISDWCAPGRTYAVWSLSPSVGRRPSVVFCIAGQAVRALREEALERLAQRMPDFGIRSVQTTTEQTKD